MKCLIVTTEGLGMGKTFVPFRTSISSCQVNRKRGGVLRPTSDSQNGVDQGGVDVSPVTMSWALGAISLCVSTIVCPSTMTLQFTKTRYTELHFDSSVTDSGVALLRGAG